MHGVDRSLRVDYDAEGDILEIFFGPPRPSIATPVDGEVEVFFSDDEEKDIVSIMVVGISKRTGVGRDLLRVPVDVIPSKSADFKSVGISFEELFAKVHAENPELIAKCEAISRERERQMAVAESPTEYKT